MIPLLLLSAALAAPGSGRLRITVDKPVGLTVDGRILDYAEDGPYAVADGLQPGQHEISVRTMTNAELWSGLVEVPSGYEVRCRWKAKQFDCYEAVAIEAFVPTSTFTIEDAGQPPVTADLYGGGLYVSETTTSSTATTGMTMGARMPTFGVVVQTGIPTTTTTTTVVTARGPAPAPLPPPSPARQLPARVDLVIRSLDGEWVDVRVDGKVMLELRNRSEGTIPVSPGKHTIEFLEFMDERPYASGRLDTAYASLVTFGITEDQKPVVYDHDGWTPN